MNHDGIKTCPDEIAREKMDIWVIDEMTCFKNGTSDRSKVAQQLSKHFRAVWGMSGNPTPNSPSEAFGQAKVINPNNPFLPRYFTKFKQMVEMEVGPYVWIPRPEAKAVVHKVLQPSIRYTRAECFDIPPMVHNLVEIEMSDEQKKAYEAMKKELYYEYEQGEISASNAGVKAMKLLQISAGAVKDNEGKILYLDDTPKIKYILDTWENDLGRGKLVVVSAFRASVERLTAVFRKEKIKCELIYGQMSLNQRTSIVNDFQTGSLQILVVQPQAVSHGLCFDATNMVIWHSLVASGETYDQMMVRIVSASQTKKQINEYLIGSKADKNIYNILSGKADFAAGVLEMFANKNL
jgi:SNF2 family DNA or RNA helicase